MTREQAQWKAATQTASDEYQNNLKMHKHKLQECEEAINALRLEVLSALTVSVRLCRPVGLIACLKICIACSVNMGGHCHMLICYVCLFSLI